MQFLKLEKPEKRLEQKNTHAQNGILSGELAPARDSFQGRGVVPGWGAEPPRPEGRRILSSSHTEKSIV
jgi:hypothetical protein